MESDATAYGKVEIGDLRCLLRIVQLRPENNRLLGCGQKMLRVGRASKGTEETCLLARLCYAAYTETAAAAQVKRYVYRWPFGLCAPRSAIFVA